ncbi:MAG: BisC [Myxococcaceae bacterium]|nr:BisC [Myxococcaceae bacterium]
MKRPALTRKWKLSRRELMKLAPLGGVAAAGAGAVGLLTTKAQAKTRGTCRFCLMHCGVVATSRGSRLERVEGDLDSKTRGFLCLHGHALREVVHSHERLSQPLMRKGSAFVTLSWPDALGEIAKRLEAIKQKHGPESLLIQTGWPLVRHPLINLLHRFARAYGSPNVATVASLCEASVRMGQALVVGSKLSPDYQRSKTLVLWGANPWRTAPPFAQLVARKAEEGALVVIDPVRHESAALANEYLQVKPGSDGALALAMIHVVIEEKLYPEPFISEWTRGFDGLRALAARFKPGEVAGATGIEAERIAKVARRLAADAPTCIWPGLGVEHHVNGVQTVRALSALETLCGRFVDPVAQRAFLTPELGPDQLLPALYRMSTAEPVPPPLTVRPLGYDEFPLFEVYNREAQGNLWPKAALTGKPYPIRALMLVASNALVTAPDPAEAAQACEKLELLVTIDTFLSASAQRSDFVLPAAGFAETTDGDKPGLVPPQREAWPDWKIVFELARAMGLGRYFPWNDFREALAAQKTPWMEDAAHQPKTEGGPRRFPTPSGKIEFQSAVLERFGFPPLPEWTAPTPAPSAEFPLWLVVGPRTAPFINSQFRQIPSVRSKAPEPTVLLNPQSVPIGAQYVRLITPHGEVRVKVEATTQVAPGVAVLPAGWESLDVNRLLGPCALDPISGFPAFRGGVARVVLAAP